MIIIFIPPIKSVPIIFIKLKGGKHLLVIDVPLLSPACPL